ncbi:Rpn family recombination-promoting nuclease/putative transposase [Anabaena sp. CCY 0017]|uniref:Rpn family recombination-promoting nuclease/putative transposase n=1 Tax=Anabaena sp. CCY 0017 TaxID=3103866 RepID=UPI0039C712F2
MAYDSICRFLTSEYPSPFVKWLLNSAETNIQVLPTELSVEPIRSDALFQLPELGSILHLEFQTVPKSKPSLPVRMLDYWLRIYRKYECPIEQVVIFFKETNSPAVYINELAVGKTRHEYRIIRLWEQDPKPLLANPALLPLAVLAKTDAPAGLLEQVAVEIDKIEEREQQQNITACVEMLAALKFDKQLIHQYFREELMQESPIYQEILEKGAKKGKLQTLTRLLSRQFGTISDELQQQLQALSINQLDDLSDALFDFSETSDLAVWLQKQQ